MASALTLTCPECRKEVAMGRRGVDDFPRNFQLAGIVEAFKRDATGRGGVGDGFQLCAQHRMGCEIMCKSCDKQICVRCLTDDSSHKKHKMQVLSKRDKTGPSASGERVCVEHDRSFRFYCEHCSTLACLECALKGHDSHKLNTIEDAYMIHSVSLLFIVCFLCKYISVIAFVNILEHILYLEYKIAIMESPFYLPGYIQWNSALIIVMFMLFA